MIALVDLCGNDSASQRRRAARARPARRARRASARRRRTRQQLRRSSDARRRRRRRAHVHDDQALNPSLLGNVRIRLYVDARRQHAGEGLTIEYQPNAQQPLVRKMLDSTIDSCTSTYLDGSTALVSARRRRRRSRTRAVRADASPESRFRSRRLLGADDVHDRSSSREPQSRNGADATDGESKRAG